MVWESRAGVPRASPERPKLTAAFGRRPRAPTPYSAIFDQESNTPQGRDVRPFLRGAKDGHYAFNRNFLFPNSYKLG